MGAQRCELPTWESMDLLKARSVGRVCIIEHAYPLAIPINYRVVSEGNDTRIVILTAADTTLGRYEGLGSLEVDEVDLDKGSAWSLIVRGVLAREPDSNGSARHASAADRGSPPVAHTARHRDQRPAVQRAHRRGWPGRRLAARPLNRADSNWSGVARMMTRDPG